MKLLAALSLLFIAWVGYAFMESRKLPEPELLTMQAAPLLPRSVEQTIPVDASARAKFPNVRGDRIDALSFINRFVNLSITYTGDVEQYGRRDHWVMHPVSGKGDCEDYVLTKYHILLEAGFPVLGNARVRSVMAGIQGHAILELLMPDDGSILFMDNATNELMTRPELEARGYKFFDW